MILLRISLRILIGFYKDFTNFYGFVKKMVQKNQYTYNVPPGPSDYIYNEARRAEFTDGWDGWMDGWMGWDGWDGRNIKSILQFSSNSNMLTNTLCAY